MKKITLLLIIISFNLSFTQDQTKSSIFELKPDTTIYQYDFPQIDVIGRKKEVLNRIPGSGTIIESRDLERIVPLTGNEVFKLIPGLNVVDEEGLGLRVNIGIRGLDPDRSRTILMLEDGIPIALAPYGEPEMYYTPSIDRMAGLEVLKGSGSILFGPQTIGGVINYITFDPPKTSTMKLNLRGGNYGIANGLFRYGTTYNNVGVNLTYSHKQAENFGTTTFRVNDISAKFKVGLSEKSNLGIKVSAYDENSNSTYVGLTQTMYDAGDYYTVIAPNDRLNIRRYSASVTHDYFINNSSYLRTTLFGYTTTRNWLRQDFSRAPHINGTGIVFGDQSVTRGAIYMRNSTGNRNRQFEVVGAEPRYFVSYFVGNIKNDLDAGYRFLYERAFEQRINGKKANAESGDLVEDEIRTGYANSLFVQNKIHIEDNFTITPGVRLENFSFNRNIFRISSKDTAIAKDGKVFEVVPGIGFTYGLTKNITLFTGIHRGFAPPRVKDAINNQGVSLELDAELSWNSELGIRYNSNLISFELTGYMLDFSNQIIPVSNSSGGTGTGLVNGGKTLHTGIETAISYDFNNILKSDYNIILNTAATFSNSKYNSDRFITKNSEVININGLSLPYAPKFYMSVGLNIATPFGLFFGIKGNYVDKQFSDEINSVEATKDGLSGEIAAHFVMDFSAKYFVNSLNSSIYFTMKNLLDERYIATRRPEGIKVGIPRVFNAGIELSL